MDYYTAIKPDEPFKVTDHGSANWAARKLSDVRQAQAARKAFYRDEKEKLDKWLADEIERLEGDARYLSGHLEQYMRDENDKNPRTKTLHLPNGTLALRKSPDKLNVDLDAFVPWAKDNHPEWLTLHPEEWLPTKTAIKKQVESREGKSYDSEGEAVPGIEVVAGEVRFEFSTERGNDE